MQQKMKMISHQGTRVYAPENSLPGYKKAAEMGFYALNFAQVRASKEGTLYVMHDSSVDRTTDGSGELALLTDSEIAKLTLDRVEPYAEYRLSDFSKEELRVPSLEQLTALCVETGVKPMIRLGIEIRQNEPAAAELFRIVRQYGIGDKMLLSGSPETLAWLDGFFPETPKIFYSGTFSPSEMICELDRFHWHCKTTVFAMLRASALLQTDANGETGIALLLRAGYGAYSSNPGDMTDPEGARAIYKKLNNAGCTYANGERLAEYE